jgi:hypothetical protein
MRKFIATACAFTILGFTIALANADTTETTSSSSTTTTGQMGQEGVSKRDQSTASGMNPATRPTDSMSGIDPNQDPYNSGGNMGSSAAKSDSNHSGGAAGTAGDEQSMSTTHADSKWKDSKTCTDVDGVTYYRGKKGYEHCVTASAAKKNAKKDQMSGTAGNDTMKDNSVQKDSSGMGDPSSSDSHGTVGGSTDSTSPTNNGGSYNQ